MCQLMSNDYSHSLFASGRVSALIIKEGGLSVRYQPPVLHRPSREIRDGKQVCVCARQ